MYCARSKWRTALHILFSRELTLLAELRCCFTDSCITNQNDCGRSIPRPAIMPTVGRVVWSSSVDLPVVQWRMLVQSCLHLPNIDDCRVQRLDRKCIHWKYRRHRHHRGYDEHRFRSKSSFKPFADLDIGFSWCAACIPDKSIASLHPLF